MPRLLIFVIVLSFINAQEYLQNVGTYYDGTNNYKFSNNGCISKYRDLELYVLNNQDVTDRIAEIFFPTGKPATEFVKIVYQFQLLVNNPNNTDDYDDDNRSLCVNDQRSYIWSSSALYLLGPEPLFWMTLFAVFVPKSIITIQLPCLCSVGHDGLLSRLTYLVRVAIE